MQGKCVKSSVTQPPPPMLLKLVRTVRCWQSGSPRPQPAEQSTSIFNQIQGGGGHADIGYFWHFLGVAETCSAQRDGESGLKRSAFIGGFSVQLGPPLTRLLFAASARMCRRRPCHLAACTGVCTAVLTAPTHRGTFADLWFRTARYLADTHGHPFRPFFVTYYLLGH